MERHTDAGLAIRPALSDFGSQGAACEALIRDFKRREPMHATLLSGVAGLGKRTFARLLAQAYFCEETNGDKPCGACPACRRVEENTHPDLIALTPQDKALGVEDIRGMLEALSSYDFGGAGRVVILEAAERSTAQAQNALLKTLEEPISRVAFLLVANDASQLLPTVRSRCAPVALHPWSDADLLGVLLRAGVSESRARELLPLAEGCVGKAVALLRDTGAETLYKDMLAVAFAARTEQDALAATAFLKDEKKDKDAVLLMAFHIAREMLAARASGQTGALPESYPPALRTKLGAATEASLLRVLMAVSDARRKRAAQVNWQSVVDQMMKRILEETTSWQP